MRLKMLCGRRCAGYGMPDYQGALAAFNQTIANMSSFEQAQHANAISEINAIQAQSMDPSDMDAYNMTMSGMDAIHGLTGHIIDTVGNASNYAIGANATVASIQTEHTSVSSSFTTDLINHAGNTVASAINDPGSLLSGPNTGLLVLGAVVSVALGLFLSARK